MQTKARQQEAVTMNFRRQNKHVISWTGGGRKSLTR